MERQNVGPLDRATRIILGSTLIAYRYLGQFSGIGWDLAVLFAAVTVWEGILGYCFLYGVFGLSTKRRHRTRSPSK